MYLLAILFFNSLIALLRGKSLGDWLYPYRVSGADFLYQPILIVWMKIVGVLFVKVNIMIIFAYLLANLIRQTYLTMISLIFITITSAMVTTYLPSLQDNWNLFYFDYRYQLIGQRVYIENPATGMSSATLQANLIQWQDLANWLGILTLMLLATLYLHRLNLLTFSFESNKKSVLNYHSKFYGFQFESRKLTAFIPNNLFKISLILIGLVFISLISIHDYQSQLKVQDIEVALAENQKLIDFFENNIIEIESFNKEQGFPSVESSPHSVMLEFYEKSIELFDDFNETLLSRRSAFKNQQSQSFYSSFATDLEIHYNANSYTIDDSFVYRPKYEYYINGDFPTLYGYEVSKNRLDEMIQRNIAPIAQTGVTLTPYDQAVLPSDQLNEVLTHQMADTSFMGIWYRLITIYRFDLLILCLILIFCGAGYTLEKGQLNALDWLYTLPYKRTLYLQYKWIVAMKKALTVLLILISLVFVAGSIQGGIGQADVPMLFLDSVVDNLNDINAFENSYHWVNLGETIFISIVLLICAAIFTITLSIFISTYMRESLNVIIWTILICLVGYYCVQLPWMENLSRWIPFAYLNIGPALDGSLIFTTTLQSVNWQWSCSVLLASSALLYGLTYWRVKYYNLK